MSELFILLVDLALKRGHSNIKDQLLTLTVDEQWSYTINGYGIERDKIPPYHASIVFNGWPAGIVGAHTGVIAAGEAANEDALIAALRAAGAEVPPP